MTLVVVFVRYSYLATIAEELTKRRHAHSRWLNNQPGIEGWETNAEQLRTQVHVMIEGESVLCDKRTTFPL